MAPSKTDIRNAVRASRAARSSAERRDAESGLTRELLTLITREAATRVAVFLPTATEPPISKFLETAHSLGIALLTPRAHEDGSMTWVAFTPEAQPVLSALGVPEIADGEALSSPDALTRVDLILLPAAAVDIKGTRLGWGKGFYDRALASVDDIAPTFAIVFDDEVLTAVPSEAHDQPVSGVVTPTQIIDFD